METDPRFTNQRTWLNSDYLLGQLSLDAAGMQQRIGDGFYEQWLIREQVSQLTGRRYLENYSDDEAQYRALMEAGVTLAQDWNLRPGVALSAEQLARLTSDIVWLVEETVRLPDGTLTTALVPKVYLVPREGDLDGNGTLISAESIDLRLEGDLVNSGTLAGRSVVQLSGDNLRNLGGRISGEDVLMQARTDLENLGGRIDAQDSLLLSAGRDLTVASTTHSEQNSGENWSASRTNLDRVAGLYVSNPGGTLVLAAGQDITLAGAEVVNDGAGSQTLIAAGRDLTLAAVHTENQHTSSERVDTGKPKGFLAELLLHRPADTHSESQTKDIGTTLRTGGDLTLQAGGNLFAQAAQVRVGGDLQASAGGDLLIVSGSQSASYSLAGEGVTVEAQDSTQRSSGFNVTGDMHLSAGNDLLLMASQLKAGGDASLTAGNDIALLAGQNYSYSLTEYQHKGSFGRQTHQRDEVTDLSHVGSSVASGGNLTLQSGGDQRYQAANLQSDGDLTLDSGGAIAFEGVKDVHQENHASSSSDWSWMKTSGEGWTDETLRQSALVAQGNLVIKAVEGIQLDIKEIDEHSVSQTIDAMVAADPQLAWLKEMEQRGDIDWQRVKEVHDSYEYDQQGMGPATAIAVAIAVSAVTSGAASALVGSMSSAAAGSGALMAAAGTTAAGTAVGAGLGNVVATAALTSMASTAAMSTINNGGDIDVVFKDVTSSDNMKGYATSMLAAGLASGLVDPYINGGQPTTATKGFDLSTWSGSGGYALNSGAQALTQAAAQSLVNGESFEDSLKGALVSQAYSTLQALSFHAVGDFAEEMNWDEGSPEKIALHATVGGLLSKAMGGDFATGAAAAGANEALMEHLSKGLKLDNELEQAASQLIGLIAAGLVEGDLQQGSDIAKNATAFNRQLHKDEEERLRQEAERLEATYGKPDSGLTWLELLTAVATARVDQESNLKLQQQLAALGHNPETDQIDRMLQFAANVVDNLAAEQVQLRWRNGETIVADGDAVYAFSATQEQFEDSNLFSYSGQYERGADGVLDVYRQYGEKQTLAHWDELGGNASFSGYQDTLDRIATVGGGGVLPVTWDLDLALALTGSGAGAKGVFEWLSAKAGVAGGKAIGSTVVATEKAALERIALNPKGPDLAGKAPNTVLNDQAIRNLKAGELPGTAIGGPGTPREMAATPNPNATAEDFANKLFAGAEIDKKYIPGCDGCWRAKNNDNEWVTYRPAGGASNKTSPTTATVEINSPDINSLNANARGRDEYLKLKFPVKSEVVR